MDDGVRAKAQRNGDGKLVPLQPKDGIQMKEAMGRDEGEPAGSVASTEENTANSQ